MVPQKVFCKFRIFLERAALLIFLLIHSEKVLKTYTSWQSGTNTLKINENKICSKYTINTVPNQNLLVQNKQKKQQNNMWNLFEVNSKDTTLTSAT